MLLPMLLRFMSALGIFLPLVLVVGLWTSKTNLIEPVFFNFSGAFHFTASNNDCGVRDFDMEKFQLSKHFQFPWPVNVSPLDCIFWLFIPRNGHLVILGCICIDSMGNKFYMLQIISHDIRADDDSFNYISNDAKILHLPATWNHEGATWYFSALFRS